VRLTTTVDWLMDKAVVPGYSRLGPAVRRAWWPPDPAPDALAGHHVVVTGASSGLGEATVVGLARLGATVHMLGRRQDRLDSSAARVRDRLAGTATPAPELVTDVCDVSDLDAVRTYAADLGERIDALHALVHGAGVLPPERVESAQGHELVYATHVLGPFLLTALLRPLLRADGDARVVWVSSGGMYTRTLDATDLETTEREFSGTDAYARTKRMQVVLADMWADRLRTDQVAVHSMHPGWAATPGLTESLAGFARVARPLLRTPDEGADTIVWLTAAEPASVTGGCSGAFWSDRHPRSTTFLPAAKAAPDERATLWAAVTKAVGTAPH
jgi:NAD(P)-dependent dehydrogenase (short-subunit alcohol dehydrogenase family)